MYKRPVFRLFTTEDQRVASIKDPIPTGEATPGSGQVFSPYNFGKLLGSGEAGYYDIQNQDYSIERAGKPSGEGIDYSYPHPPDLSGVGSSDPYWGLPKNLPSSIHPDSGIKAYFQSGIFVYPNDDAYGSGLDYYYIGSGIVRNSGEPDEDGEVEVTESGFTFSVGSGIFHYNEVSGKFSNAFDSINSGLLNEDGTQFYKDAQAKCLPNPYGFNIMKPEFLTRDLILPMSSGEGDEIVPVVVPFLGDYEVITAPVKPDDGGSGLYKNNRNEIKGKVEKILEGYTDIEIKQQETTEQDQGTDNQGE